MREDRRSARWLQYISRPAFTEINNVIPTWSKTQQPMSPRQLTEFSGVRMSVEHAFGILKMKFKILRDPLEYGETEKGIRIVKSCIWLNNFIIDNNHQH